MNRAGKLICLPACLHECNRVGLIDKASFLSNYGDIKSTQFDKGSKAFKQQV